MQSDPTHDFAPDFEADAELLKAIAHPVRLHILHAIRTGEQAVNEIEERTGIVQPGLSQQLGILRKAQLVTTRREGKQIFYAIDAARMQGAGRMLTALTGAGSETGVGPDARPPETIHMRSGGAAVFARIVPRD